MRHTSPNLARISPVSPREGGQRRGAAPDRQLDRRAARLPLGRQHPKQVQGGSRDSRETAERQPRGSREAAERQPRGSRETAERQPRGSREAAERQPRDNNLPNHADDLTPRLSSLLPLYPARPCRPRSTPSSSSSGSTRASACSTTPLAPPTRQDLASITGRGGWASPELLSGPFSSRRLASPTTPPSTR